MYAQNAKQNRKQENKIGLVSQNVILIKNQLPTYFFEKKTILGLLKKIESNLACGLLWEGT